MIRTIQQGLLADGFQVSIAKLCSWFEVPRRTVYYKPLKSAPKVDARFETPIKDLIEKEPSFVQRDNQDETRATNRMRTLRGGNVGRA